MPPKRAVPMSAVVDMRSQSTKRVKEDGEACEPPRRPMKQAVDCCFSNCGPQERCLNGCNCPLDCELNAGMPRELCLNHSEDGKAREPSASLGVASHSGGTPPKVLRNKHGQAICPPGCPRDGKHATGCRTHGGGAMCPIGCTANKALSMLKAYCPEHKLKAVSGDTPPKVPRDKYGNAICPPGCTRAEKLASGCRTHGGSAMCPIGCTANKSPSMLKANCPDHKSEAARKPKKPRVRKQCPPECPRAGKLAGLCEEHGGWLLCKKPCPNAGNRKEDCMNGCGGWARCQAPCKNEGNRKLSCRDCDGSGLCDNCEIFIVSDSSGLCSDCRNATSSNSRVREKQMEQSLQGWATQGHIPIYTLWNKQVPDTDSAVCGKHRPDFTFVTDASAVVLEFDEYQHEPYTQSCELARMSDIYLSYHGLPVTFIRYNPDAFKVDGTTLVTKRETREAVLLDVLKEALTNTDSSNSIVIHYICHDIPAKGQTSGGSNYVQTHRFVDVNEYQTWAVDSTSASQ